MDKENIEAVKEEAVENFGQGSVELAAMNDDDSEILIHAHDFDHSKGYVFREDASQMQEGLLGSKMNLDVNSSEAESDKE